MNAAEIRDKLQQCGAEKLHDPTVRPAGETKRLQASCLSLLTDILAARNSPEQQENEEENTEEELYRALMEALMSYIGLVTKQEQVSRGQGTSKFWPAMLHYAYTLLNKVNLLLPTRQFLGVVRGVLESSTGDEGVRARALEVLGARLQLRAAAQLSPHERLELLALVPSLKVLSLSEAGPAAERALFCLRILSKQLASTTPHTFTPVLTTLIQALENETMTTSILAGTLLCIAELVFGLRAAAVPSLPRLVPLVLKFSSQHRAGQDPNELVLLGTAATLQRLVETLPNFLSPFLPGVLRELCLLSAVTPSHVSVRANAVLNPRLTAIRGGVGRIPLRILLPATTTVFAELRAESLSLPALGPLLSVLSASFADLERTHDEDDQTLVTEAEDHVITALVALVMKLPETLFRPLYFQLSAWSSEAEQSLHLRSRCITFYRCSTSLANSLKGLFVVFAFYFLKQAAGLLRRCHSGVNQGEEPLFPSEGQICLLLESVLETLLALENMVGGEERLRERCSRLVAPCLAQFARATADDMLWKQLHYQILLKTRHTSPTVRLVAVGAIKSLAGALGEELLPLLPEAVPFLAELLEDEDGEVETACQDAVRDLERILGEPLHKYF
ncbi:hypothetical protein B566_EDAN012243 [Ephemera danica]|nr:hypothetical protein B566_EDAN012243 [Ephemera danica]